MSSKVKQGDSCVASYLASASVHLGRCTPASSNLIYLTALYICLKYIYINIYVYIYIYIIYIVGILKIK